MKHRAFLIAIVTCVSMFFVVSDISAAPWLFSNPKFQALDSNGDPLNGGKLDSFDAGTSTRRATYPTSADATAETNANANPIILDSRGEATIYGKGAYKFVLKDSSDVTIWTIDNIDIGAASGSNVNYLSEYVDTNAPRSAFHVAIDDIGGTVTELVVDVSATLTESETVPATLSLRVNNGAILTATGYVLTILGSFDAGLYEVFNAVGGEVVFGAGSVEATRPEWFETNTDPGASDMTAALRAAYDATLTGGRMRLLPTTYLITSGLAWDSKVHVKGTSRQVTKILKQGSFTGVTVSSNEAQIEDFHLDGDTGNGGIGMLVSDGDLSSFNRLRVSRHGSHGLSITTSQIAEYNNLTLDTNTGDGLRIDDTGGGAITSTGFTNIFSHDNGAWGFNLLGGDTLVGSNIVLQDNTSGEMNIDHATRNFFSIYCENDAATPASLTMSSNSGKNHIVFVEIDNDGVITDSSSDGNVVSGTWHGSAANKYPEWETPTFSAGDYTYSGSNGWTVETGDVTTNTYIQQGKVMIIALDIRTSTITTGDGTTLQVALPDGKTANKTVYNACKIYDNGAWVAGTISIDSSAQVLKIQRLDEANFTVATNLVAVRASITIEVR